MLDPKDLRRGAAIELYDAKRREWLPLTIISIVFDNIECRTLANEPILTTSAALIRDARVRPSDGSCRDCVYEAHDGPCVERTCSECGAEVSSRCSQHPTKAVHVYRRMRYLAEIVEDRPYPTRESADALRRDLQEQMRVLRNGEQPRQGRVIITAVERSEVVSALENALALIAALPGERKKSR